MFGVGQIIQGHYNEIVNKENDLYNTRIKICKECPLYSINTLGEVCDAKKCIDQSTGVIYTLPKIGRVCGCGCRLSAKTRVPEAKCVLNKW